MLKIDIEGAEIECLTKTKELDRCIQVVGEVHFKKFQGFNLPHDEVEKMVANCRELGFDFTAGYNYSFHMGRR